MQRFIEFLHGRDCRDATQLVVVAVLATCCCLLQPADAELAAVALEADVVVLDNGAAIGVEQQLRGQFEPLLKVELSFVNRVCKLSDDQRRNLIAKSNEWLMNFIKDYSKQGGQPLMQGARFGGGQPQVADPRESIQKGVTKLVKAELPKEQAAIYVDESTKRAGFSQKTSVDNLVARIDNALILSPEQRDKLSKSLTEHWDKSWAPQIEMFMHGVDMWPNVPDQWIRPHLSPAQQVAWGKLNKHSGHVFFGGMGNEGQVIDDIDLDEGKDKKDKAADDKAAEAAEELRHRLGAQRATN